ncbi:STAS domain-containing protein [Streptomyces sp. DHE7-1]|uniref:STAS domain-containing protein n=1 Tax=unclassified Streptomyces TaxID=2593676 RepID=UPI0018EE4DC6|nr:STAS domain-containing protein [Streptomyces sp. DHE7-1]
MLRNTVVETDTDKPQEPELLEVVSTTTDGITVVTAAGEIDHSSAGRLVQALDPGGLGERPRVVVDMERVTFIDSSGINVLLAAHRDLTAAGGWLRLANASTYVLRTLQIVGIDTLVPCCGSLGEALTA